MEADVLTVHTSIAPSQVSLGEPVLLNYQLRNHTDHALYVCTGPEEPVWCRMELRDSSGAEVPRLPRLSTLNPEPPQLAQWTRGIDQVEVYPGESSDQRVAISYWFDLRKIGEYELRLRITTTWGRKFRRGQVGGRHQVHRFEITPRDPQRLAQAAAALHAQLEAEYRQNRGDWVMHALLSMPEADVWDVWLAIACDMRHASNIARDFCRILSSLAESVTAVDILTEVAWEANLEAVRWGEGVRAWAVEGLIRLALHGTPEVRQRAAASLEAHPDDIWNTLTDEDS